MNPDVIIAEINKARTSDLSVYEAKDEQVEMLAELDELGLMSHFLGDQAG